MEPPQLLPIVKHLVDARRSAIAHITGGGITGDLPPFCRGASRRWWRRAPGRCLLSSPTCSSSATCHRTTCCAPSVWDWAIFDGDSGEEVQEGQKRYSTALARFYTVGRIAKGDRKVMYT